MSNVSSAAAIYREAVSGSSDVSGGQLWSIAGVAKKTAEAWDTGENGI
jgi:hypothetical protein